jgi:hypothetical protein
MAVCWSALMPGVDTDGVEVEFVGADAIGCPGGQAGAAEAGQVGAVRARGTAASKPVVAECEGFEVWQDIVWVDDEAVTPSGGHRSDLGADSQQVASGAAGATVGCSGDDEWGAPRVGVNGVVSAGDGGGSPAGLLVPAVIWVIDVRNGRERHQVPGERGPTLGAVEEGHTSGSTVCQPVTRSAAVQWVDEDINGCLWFIAKGCWKTWRMKWFPANPDSLSAPVTLLDDQGVLWVLHRRRVDLRIVRRLVKDTATLVVWGDMGGISPRLTTEAERPVLWDQIKDEYNGPGGAGSTGRYLAHVFLTESGRRMLYVEDHC